jgi:hypothetical protein
MEVLNGYLKVPPTLKNSPKAVATTKKENVPFGEADLASIILATGPIMWQNQYSLTHSTVPESPCTLLADLENIKRVMLECYNYMQWLKDKAVAAHPDKGKHKRGASGGGSSNQESTHREVLPVVQDSVACTRRTIRANVVTATRMVSPAVLPEVSHLASISPTKSMGMRKGWLI